MGKDLGKCVFVYFGFTKGIELWPKMPRFTFLTISELNSYSFNPFFDVLTTFEISPIFTYFEPQFSSVFQIWPFLTIIRQILEAFVPHKYDSLR